MDKTASQAYYFGLIVLTVSIISLFFIYSNEPSITSLVILEDGQDPSLVLNVTFDNQANPWKDYSIYDHNIRSSGRVSWVDKSVCKWYGCANMIATSDDFLTSAAKWENMSGIAVSWWVYHTERPQGSSSQYYFQFGDETNGTLKSMQDGGYGPSIEFACENGKVSGLGGSSVVPQANAWYFYFIQYDPQDGMLSVWQNDQRVVYEHQDFGPLNYSVGEMIRIGYGKYNINVHGYMDEFLAWNRGNFSDEEILESYESKRLGTPPELDLYVKSIKYEIPYDWEDSMNRLSPGQNMDIVFTIANAGTKDSRPFDYRFMLDDAIVCSANTALAANGEINITCPWNPEFGFHAGKIELDISDVNFEDNEVNNVQSVYIPFLNRPWFHFDLEEWNNILSFNQDSDNEIAYDTYRWVRSFLSSDFNEGLGGNDVDPRGKKGRENAMGCLANNYVSPQGKPMCEFALNHLNGWASRPLESYNNVQAIHELIHVGMVYDLMFPLLSESENKEITKKFHDICQQITNLENVRPDLDDDSIISGENGAGFGSGMAGFCYTLLGSYPENPTLIQQTPQQYWGSNIADEWMDREESYLRAYKNDQWSKYQERISYKWYSQFHLVENWFFQKRADIGNVDEYQPALCAMAREAVTDVLDFNARGSLRNDHNQYLRTVQAGDSKSYENIGSDSFVNYAILTYYGLLCDNADTKQAILWLKNYAYSKGEGRNSYPDIYLYKQLYDQVNGISASPQETFPKIIFDNANDILTIRPTYSYQNDDVIQIDGGEERGGGHSQAQGYYLYALGGPFLDYEQVPYDDDVRMDTWKNGISLQNTAQSKEGEGGVWNNKCGDAGYNQYYGMSDCPKPTYPDDYPNFRQFPIEYGGDLEDYGGSSDGRIAGVFVYRPYKNADNVEEYFIKFNDLLAKRTKVKTTTPNGIYHNFININEEFNETRSGNNLTFERGNKNLDINVIYADQALTLGGGKTNLRYCFSKTSCSGSSQGLGYYRRTYLHTPANNIDFILAHNWYYDNEKASVAAISKQDNGMQQGNSIILFDTNNDGLISYNGYKSDGWGLAFDPSVNEVAAFNATTIKYNDVAIFASDKPVTAYLKRESDKITLNINTMTRDGYIDYPKTARIAIDAYELSQNSGFIITKNNEQIAKLSEKATLVEFNAQSGQNGDEYIITGTGSDLIPLSIVNVIPMEITATQAIIQIVTNEPANKSLSWIYRGTINTVSDARYALSSNVTLTGLKPESLIYYSAKACEPNGNCVSSQTYNLTTASQSKAAPKNNTRPPKGIKFNGESTDFSKVDDLERIEKAKLEIVGKGSITFKEETNMSGLDLDYAVEIERASITIDTKNASSLNRSATLTMYGLDLDYPYLEVDGERCSNQVCAIDSYEDGNLTFNVSHFSTYSAVETPLSPEPEIEASDSSKSSSGSSSGGGGASSAQPTINNDEGSIVSNNGALPNADPRICVPNWKCSDWSACIDKIQTRSCVDKNNCGNLKGLPEKLQACSDEKQSSIKTESKDHGSRIPLKAALMATFLFLTSFLIVWMRRRRYSG